jgi:glyoxylase-like metal-dependent hydrolase (beta-lactamase superfamily II)
VTRVELPGRDVIGIRAANPSPLTLTGTNSWIVGRDPAWLVDPGPGLPEHVEAVSLELARRGGLGGIALTHDHFDHSEAVGAIQERFPGAQLAGGRGDVTLLLSDEARVGPLEALATPGHSPDHYVFLFDGLGFTGDAVLGEGSVFLAPDPGALAGYLNALAELRRRAPELLCPGHGPVIEDPEARLEAYISHRREREQRLLAALREGARTVDEMLDAAWSDAPPALRPAAALTLAAHLDKLEEEGRLPPGVERPRGPASLGAA